MNYRQDKMRRPLLMMTIIKMMIEAAMNMTRR